MALEFREDGAALSAVVAVRDRLDVATLDGGTAAERAIDASFAALYAPSRVAAAVAAEAEAVGVAPAALSAALRARRPSAADLNAVAWRLCAFRGADPAQYADALARASAAVEIDPDNGWFLNTYGCALLRAGRLTEAAATLERAAALNGDFGPDQSLLAVVRARLGERDAALAALEKARRLSGLPGDFDTLLAEAEAACRGL
jgi:predicted Zn-dependent protease